MPDIADLRKRWFLDVEDPGAFPPRSRHPHALVGPYTDGNRVTPIYDGATYMARFNEVVSAMIEADDPAGHELWLHAWRIEPIKLLGADRSGPDAETLLESAARAGVKVRFLASGHSGHSNQVAARINAAGGKAATDRRLQTFGSHHQKFYVCRHPDNGWRASLGSGDFLRARYDRADCAPDEPSRPPKGGYPTHDVWLEIEGPAVHDVSLHFAERWNDPAGRGHTKPHISDSIPLDFAEKPIPPAGPHSLQLLRTYSIVPKHGFSWSHQGEYTIWAANLNAIQQASKYVYMEDQYFYSFEDPPVCQQPAHLLYPYDIVVQLGEALKRGVDVVVVVPSRKGDWRKHYELQQRGRAMTYLRSCASAPGAGRFVGCFLRKGDKDPIIHSKLMLVDDEYALVGSANIGMRSMAYDSEVSFGVVDAEGKLVREMRSAIWAKHMELANVDALADPSHAVAALAQNARDEAGRLRVLPDKLVSFSFPYRFIMNKIIDPYKGPTPPG